jgi:hypothetical protein
MHFCEKIQKMTIKTKLLVTSSIVCYTLSEGWDSKSLSSTTKKNKLHGLSPRANNTDRATAACRRSECQLLRIEDATWSA